jgi:hypothetical protein
MTVQHRPIRGFYDLRLNDANGTPGHRRGNAEGMLATNLKRGGSHEEGFRQQLIKCCWLNTGPPQPSRKRGRHSA